MIKRPLFPIAIAFAAGILLSGVVGVPLGVALVVLGFGCAVAVVKRRPAVALLCLVAGLGMARYESFVSVPKDDISRFADTSVGAVVGTIRSDVDLREDRALIPFAVQAVEVRRRLVRATGTLMLTCYRPDADPVWQPPAYGDELRVACRVMQPNSISSSNGFSWADYLAHQGIHAVATARNPEQIQVLRHGSGSAIVSLAIRAREALATCIYRSMPHEEASVVIGMDLGTYTTLPSEVLTNFQKTGTLHLLAASGFNCAVIVAVFGLILIRLLKLPKKTAAPILIMLLIFYLLMVGTKPSIVRATVMATLFLLGGLLDRPADTLNLLFAAALVILMVNPADLFDVGFQLSFAAVMSLVLVLPVIEEVTKRWRIDISSPASRLAWKHRLTLALTRDAWQGLTATTAATLGTLPLSAHYFNQFSLVSIVVNVIVASAVLPIFAVGLLLPIVSHVPVLGPTVAFLGTWITKISLASINWFGGLPHSCLYVPSPGGPGIVGYYLLLAVGVKYAFPAVSGKQRTESP